jgi:hypothetical protein
MTFLDNHTVRIFIVSATLVGVIGVLILINYLSKKLPEYFRNLANNIKDQEDKNK